MVNIFISAYNKLDPISVEKRKVPFVISSQEG